MRLIFVLLFILGLYWFFTQSKQQPFFTQSPQQPECPYHDNIEKLTMENPHYRRVLYTTSNMQLVLMSLKPGEEIGMEQHPTTSQFIRVEKGQGIALIEGCEYRLNDGDVVVIPQHAIHNIVNVGSGPLKLYSIYTPPNHPPNTLESVKNH